MTIVDVWTDAAISDLSEENLSDFEKIVILDLKGQSCTQEEKTILRENLDLWLYTLRTLRRSVEYQLSSNKLRLRTSLRKMKAKPFSQHEIDDLLTKDEIWRANSTKFLLAIEKRTLYVKLLINEED